MDNACSEYIFSTLFFVSERVKQSKTDFSMATIIFNEVFEPTIKLLYVKQIALIYCNSQMSNNGRNPILMLSAFYFVLD